MGSVEVGRTKNHMGTSNYLIFNFFNDFFIFLYFYFYLLGFLFMFCVICF
jgi:hypothetical protein